MVYLDDLIIYSKNLQEQLEKCRRVFDRLKKANLLLDAKNCLFLRLEAQVIGHIVGGGQIKPNPDIISAIKNCPIANTLEKSREFLGIAYYYRRFIYNFSVYS